MHEKCIKVTILGCGWCQGISSKSKCQVRAFPLGFKIFQTFGSIYIYIYIYTYTHENALFHSFIYSYMPQSNLSYNLLQYPIHCLFLPGYIYIYIYIYRHENVLQRLVTNLTLRATHKPPENNISYKLHGNQTGTWWRHQMKTFPRYWPFVRGIHQPPVNSPRKGQWRGALMLYLICARMNGRVNNDEAGDLRRHRAHYDVVVMEFNIWHTRKQGTLCWCLPVHGLLPQCYTETIMERSVKIAQKPGKII